MLLLVLFLPGAALKCQISPTPYLLSSEIEREDRLKQIPSKKAVAYALIGNYEKALNSYELDSLTRSSAGELIGKAEEVHINSADKITYTDAKQHILQRARQSQILIFNEAHHKVIHRVFLATLLDSLYHMGYRYLGLEALTPNFQDTLKLTNDTLLNKRGYPLNSRYTGQYTREPQFGNLIRQAIAKGFHVFGYEASPLQAGQNREIKQARNIARRFSEEPDAKMVILCGYAHLVEQVVDKPERNYGMKKWMAAYLKEYTGIDPLTINQEIFTERGTPPFHPYYGLIDAKHSSALIDSTNLLFQDAFQRKFDILVYHPPTTYKKGRPEWLFELSEHTHQFLPKKDIEIECPCLVKAYSETDSINAVPVDIIEIEDEKGVYLALPEGTFNLNITNTKDETQTIKIDVREN